MKRTLRRFGSLQAAALVVALTLSTAWMVRGESPATGNPLRHDSSGASSQRATSAPVGTAIRPSSGSLTPTQATSASGSSARESNNGRQNRSQPLAARPNPPRELTHRTAQRVEPAAYRRGMSTASTARQQTEEVLPSAPSVLHGTVTVQPGPGEVIGEEMAYDDFGVGDGGGDGCCDGQGCSQCCLVICPRFPCDDISVFAGAQGFTGPKNRGQTASFGFNEGVNWGAPLPCLNGCLAMQLGARFTQSNLSAAEFTPEARHQAFVTGGFFRRVDWGLQGGLVVDYLSDDWYTNTDLMQVRGEAAWVFPCGHELGVWAALGIDNVTSPGVVFTTPVVNAVINQTWESTDLYTAFYRHQFSDWEGTSGRIFAGFSGRGDGLIGADARVPLACNLALEAGFAYLIPEESEGPVGVGNEEESWNVAVSLVWYPGKSTAAGKSYFAPLFNVADNGSFMVDHVP